MFVLKNLPRQDMQCKRDIKLMAKQQKKHERNDTQQQQQPQLHQDRDKETTTKTLM